MRLSGSFVDEVGDPIQLADLAALTLTLYEKSSETVINNRNDIDVLNASIGTVDAIGNWTLDLTAADMAILDTNRSKETHVALLEWTYGLSGEGREEIEFQVYNMRKVGSVVAGAGSAAGAAT